MKFIIRKYVTTTKIRFGEWLACSYRSI